MKRIQKIKNRVKSKLKIIIKTVDSKHVEIVSAMKKMESVVKYIGLKQQKFQQILAKRKRLFEI